MSPRRKVLLAVLTTWSVWLLAVRILFSWLVLPTYRDLEREDTEAHLRHARDAVSRQAEALGDLTGDWAGWDDAYAFAGGEMPSFPAVNATADSFRDLGVDLMVFVDTRGALLYGGTFDRATGALAPAGDELIRHLGALPDLLDDKDDPRRRVAGLAVGPDGVPMIVAARPILTSGREGPPRGMLVFARRLSPAAVGELATMLGVQAEITPADAPTLSPTMARARDALPAAGATLVAPIAGTGLVAGYTRLDDLCGAPSVLLRVARPRVIWLHGLRTSRYMLAGLALTGALAAAALYRSSARLLAAERRHREIEALYVDFVEQSSDGVLLVDEHGRFVQANAAFRALTGLDGADVDASTIAALLGLEVADLRRVLASRRERVALGLVRFARADGRAVHAELQATSLALGAGRVVCLVVHDVTKRVEDEERERYFAYHDALTGLPNRLLFQDRLAVALHQAQRGDGTVGVMFVDLDHFKAVNDSMGHDHGDRLLIDVAARLAACVRAGDSVARQGGDEFLVLATQLGSPTDVSVLCERVLEVLRQPFRLDGQEVFLTASVGVAMFPTDGADAPTLLKNADLARYQSKEAGRNGWQLYDQGLHERVTQLVGMHTRLRHAVERDELLLHYQAQVAVGTGRILGMEALLRWCSPEEGLVPPGRFVPIAEETGMISPIGEWVLRRACAQARAWSGEGNPVRVAVNLSARQFVAPDLVALVREVLDDTGLAADLLELEITESLAMRNADSARRVLTQLKSLGVSIALDDFGTGYSSLAYLRQFPFDRLKIDRGFLLQVNNPRGRAMVAAIIDLAHAIELEVVAEGVETAEQFRVLAHKRCDMVQGFGLARPFPADEARALLVQRRSLVERLHPAAPQSPPALA